MSQSESVPLRERSCQPCEGGVAPLSEDEAQTLLKSLDGWQLESDAKKISRRWKVADFMAGVNFLTRVAEVAETEDHHPDMHLTGYRNVTIELTTHAIEGLSENDFIVASKIDCLNVDTK